MRVIVQEKRPALAFCTNMVRNANGVAPIWCDSAVRCLLTLRESDHKP